MHVVVLVLVGFLASPLTATDDYAGLSGVGHAVKSAPATAALSQPVTEIAEGDDSDLDECFCSCLLCILGLDGVSHVVAPSLQGGRMAVSLSCNLASSSYRSEVYRPPIV